MLTTIPRFIYRYVSIYGHNIIAIDHAIEKGPPPPPLYQHWYTWCVLIVIYL